MASTTRTVYKNDWQKEHTDRISLTVPKGRKEELQEHAQQQGESLNAFINRAIAETRERDKMFAEQKEEVIESAKRHGVTIESETELKQLAEAFAVLAPYLPNMREAYFRKRNPLIFMSNPSTKYQRRT